VKSTKPKTENHKLPEESLQHLTMPKSNYKVSQTLKFE